MEVRVRFAPSPTGLLHVGNARAAVANWLFARKSGGRLLLRLDDTDRERSSAAFAEAIEQDLRWLGLGWDDKARQSDRLALYAQAAERLQAAGRLYPCYESEAELALQRAAQASQGRPPRYDRAALRLRAEERARLEGEGRRPHWRFLLPDRETHWRDLVHGPIHVPGAEASDPVLLRSDGQPLYTLTSVADDIAFAITHVIRGADHIANTAAQIALFEALDATPPQFAHLPLLVDAAGQGLSKRIGSLSLAGLREDGVEAAAVTAYLARLGTGEAMAPILDPTELIGGFDLARYSRAPARFDPADLKRLSTASVHALPFAAARPRLAALGLDPLEERFWLAVRANIEALSGAGAAELAHWHRVCYGSLPPLPPDDADFVGLAAKLLPPEPWDEGTWGAWTNAIGHASGRKGRTLYGPLRRVLTQRSHGPELKNLLPLIGRARALERLCGSAT
jgi:glutamyl-tRNA synthetase